MYQINEFQVSGALLKNHERFPEGIYKSVTMVTREHHFLINQTLAQSSS